MYSSDTSTSSHSAKISAGRAEDFLTFLVNLPDEAVWVKRWATRNADLSPKRTLDDWLAFESKPEWEQRKESPFWPLPRELGQLREALRRIWKEPDIRTRDWMAYGLRYYELIGLNPALVNPEVTGRPLPAPTRFEQCLLHLAKCSDRARYCANPDCIAPYFFARRRSERYCSDACAAPGQREFKRRWWAEKGNEWRRKRKSVAKSRKK
jgi:hypothetical protein